MAATKTTAKDTSQTLKKLDSLVEVLDQDAEEIDSKSEGDVIDHWYDLFVT